MSERRMKYAARERDTLLVEVADLKEIIANQEKIIMALRVERDRLARSAELAGKPVAPPPFTAPTEMVRRRGGGRPPSKFHKAKEEDITYDVGWQVKDAPDTQGTNA